MRGWPVAAQPGLPLREVVSGNSATEAAEGLNYRLPLREVVS